MKSKVIAYVDEDFLQLAKDYLVRKRNEFETLKPALIKKDFESIESYGHKISGSAENYGFPILGKLGKQLEKACMQHNGDECKIYFSEIENFFSVVEVEVKKAS